MPPCGYLYPPPPTGSPAPSHNFQPSNSTELLDSLLSSRQFLVNRLAAQLEMLDFFVLFLRKVRTIANSKVQRIQLKFPKDSS